MASLPLSRPILTGNEERYLKESLSAGKMSGDGPFTKRVRKLLEEQLPAHAVLTTTSCTSALELAAVLLHPGESGQKPEVILPSFTFVSTANAFLLHGYKVVFCDVHVEDGNIDIASVEPLITKNTRAIVPVHYAGIPGDDLEAICALGKERGIPIVEDAAQAVFSSIRGKNGGTLGDLGCFSFHDTKNFQCGEGGALVINKPELLHRAEIIREKGTNRSQFLMGHVDKYTWVDVGGSFLPADTLMAILLSQLESRAEITARRKHVFGRYIERLAALETRGVLRTPKIPAHVSANYHLFGIVLADLEARTGLMKHLNGQEISAAFHYPALHLTPQGRTLHGDGPALPHSVALADRLLRLPLFPAMTDADVDRVVTAIEAFYV